MTEVDERFDAVVIGSGFGGSVTALRLAQAGWSVCVLERGRPFAPGDFGRSPRGVEHLMWDPDGGRFGMFDIWSFTGVNAVVGSGLGGGSLVYANVMLEKDPDTFAADGFPFGADVLREHYDAVAAIQRAERFPIAEAPYDRTGKAHALRDAAAALGFAVQHPPLAVRFAGDDGRNVPGVPIAGRNVHGVTRQTCRLCGECDLGCNFGSKSTLDLTWLSLAFDAGAQLRCLCEARDLEPRPERDGGGWRVTYHQRLDGRDDHPRHLLDPVEEPFRTVTAKHVVVAAGTVGTARLLLRNRARAGLGDLPVGDGFSTNGDVLTMGYGIPRTVDMSAGPVITTSVDVPDAASPSGRELHVQDAGAPAFAMWMLHALGLPGTFMEGAEVVASRLADKLLGRRDTAFADQLADLIGRSRTSDGTLALLSMGRDLPDGSFHVREDGDLDLTWSEDPSRAFFDGMEEVVHRLVAAMGGRPGRAPWSHLVTVHALGGAAMGRVVDADGNVLGRAGLHVADGSVMPGPVGPNPSLTIAALADKFAAAMVAAGR